MTWAGSGVVGSLALEAGPPHLPLASFHAYDLGGAEW